MLDTGANVWHTTAWMGGLMMGRLMSATTRSPLVRRATRRP